MKNKHNILLTMILVGMAFLSSCSKAPETQKVEGLTVILVDKDGNAIQDLGKERPTNLYLKVLSQPDGELSGNVEVLGDSCSTVISGSEEKISLNSQDEKTGLLNSRPIKVEIQQQCQAGDLAQIILAIETTDASTGETSAVKLAQSYDIISLGALPELLLVNYRVNGIAERPAVLFGETWSVELMVKNIGRRDLNNATFIYSRQLTGEGIKSNIKIGEEELSIASGKTLRIVIPGSQVVKLSKFTQDEVILNLSWSVKDELFSDGSLDLKIPVQRGLVVKDFLKQLVTTESINGPAEFSDRIPLDFIVNNESDLLLPVGRLWVEKVIGGSVEKPGDQIMLRGLNPRETVFVDGKNRLEIIPDKEIFSTVANARIEVVLKWQLGDQPVQGASYFIKRVEGEIWQPAN